MKLTSEEIKALIRKSQGWTELKEGPDHYGWKRGDEWHYLHQVPNYPESLDACAEFEATLKPKEWASYWAFLEEVACRPNNTPIIFATPPQRCIAYLKTKGIIQ